MADRDPRRPRIVVNPGDEGDLIDPGPFAGFSMEELMIVAFMEEWGGESLPDDHDDD